MLVIEDGTGKSNSESYCSVAEATAYFAARGTKADDWDAVEDQEAALRMATDFIQQKFRGRWKGYRVTSTQALDWPRCWVESDATAAYWPNYLPTNIVPPAVKQACAELALRTASGSLLKDSERATSSETVGPISVTYEPGGSTQVSFSAVNALLRPFLVSSSSASIVRA